MFRHLIKPTIIRALPRNSNLTSASKRLDHHYAPTNYKPPTMDDLPIPSGSWEAQYNANQTKYNMHLAAGILVFAGTLITAKTSGLLYLNFSPPEFPADPIEYDFK